MGIMGLRYPRIIELTNLKKRSQFQLFCIYEKNILFITNILADFKFILIITTTQAPV